MAKLWDQLRFYTNLFSPERIVKTFGCSEIVAGSLAVSQFQGRWLTTLYWQPPPLPGLFCKNRCQCLQNIFSTVGRIPSRGRMWLWKMQRWRRRCVRLWKRRRRGTTPRGWAGGKQSCKMSKLLQREYTEISFYPPSKMPKQFWWQVMPSKHVRIFPSKWTADLRPLKTDWVKPYLTTVNPPPPDLSETRTPDHSKLFSQRTYSC